ncbi:TIGR02611 family protein [Actinomycetes bacterium KLBMP 9759]
MALNSMEKGAGKGSEGPTPLGFRARIEERPTLRRAWIIGVGVVGVLVLAAGIVAIPYPGPGWLIVFAGLAILATEFVWARRLLHYARGKYDAWTDWLGRQTLIVRLLVLAATGLIVLATLYLLNAMYMVADWVGLGHWTWLQSPLFG